MCRFHESYHLKTLELSKMSFMIRNNTHLVLLYLLREAIQQDDCTQPLKYGWMVDQDFEVHTKQKTENSIIFWQTIGQWTYFEKRICSTKYKTGTFQYTWVVFACCCLFYLYLQPCISLMHKHHHTYLWCFVLMIESHYCFLLFLRCMFEGL